MVASCRDSADIVGVSDAQDTLGKLNSALAGRYEVTRELGRGGMVVPDGTRPDPGESGELRAERSRRRADRAGLQAGRPFLEADLQFDAG